MSTVEGGRDESGGTAGIDGVDLKLEPSVTSFNSADDLAGALRRAAAAHGEHEKRIGRADPDWPDWYAEYMAREQTGQELPT